jgi:hypothetical protein
MRFLPLVEMTRLWKSLKIGGGGGSKAATTPNLCCISCCRSERREKSKDKYYYQSNFLPAKMIFLLNFEINEKNRSKSERRNVERTLSDPVSEANGDNRLQQYFCGRGHSTAKRRPGPKNVAH